MDEATKTRNIWGDLERSILCGEGIDIGAGKDPVLPDVRRFDVEHGDANEITKYVNEQFDFVFSSHCLEHMSDPVAALTEWWKLVRPGGHLFIIVPDEDLYEQGVFPSTRNGDHKATFTIAKTKSWSPVSYNLLDLVRELPAGELVDIRLQDTNYNRGVTKHGKASSLAYRVASAAHFHVNRVLGRTPRMLNRILESWDQTRRPHTLAQIQCIVRKRAEEP